MLKIACLRPTQLLRLDSWWVMLKMWYLPRVLVPELIARDAQILLVYWGDVAQLHKNLIQKDITWDPVDYLESCITHDDWFWHCCAAWHSQNRPRQRWITSEDSEPTCPNWHSREEFPDVSKSNESAKLESDRLINEQSRQWQALLAERKEEKQQSVAERKLLQIKSYSSTRRRSSQMKGSIYKFRSLSIWIGSIGTACSADLNVKKIA